MFYVDSEADIPSTEVSGAICVQKFDDSRNSAIHTTYRISLRSSSLREPRHPLLGVISWLFARPATRSTETPTFYIVINALAVVLKQPPASPGGPEAGG